MSWRLQAGHDAHREVALAGQRANGDRDDAGGDTGDLAEQATPVQTIRPESLGDGERHLPMRHGREERGVLPLRPDFESLGMTIGAEVPALAGAREQILVRAGVAADARELVVEHAAGEELVSDLGDDGAPRAVLAREALVVDRLHWRLEPVRGQRPPHTIVVDSGPVRYLRLDGQARAAFFGHALAPPIGETDGEFRWRWRVVQSPDGADLRVSSRDDAALRVFVVFRRTRWRSRTPRTLFYTIGGTEPATYERPSFASADLHVLRAGGARDSRDWVDVVVDPAADYRRVWGAAAPPIEGVGLMQDTDQTRSAAVADVQFLTWRPRS